MAQDQARFLSGSLTGHIITMSLTSAVGFVALFVVDLIDMIFISMLGVEELAAAVGFAGTLLFATTSVGIGLGIAGGALVARALGEGDAPRASALLTHTLIIGVVVAVCVATAVYVSLEPLTALIGARGVTQQMAISYLSILVPTMPVLIVGIVVSAALRSHGAARLSMLVTLTAGLVNAVLDPILIFGFDMGLQGAAWASVAARFAMAGLSVWLIISRFGGFCALSLGETIADLRPVFTIAAPAILANIATPIGGAFVTRAASEFGEPAVAGMAVIGRITPIAFALIFAMSGAIGPIIGQNFGAKRHDRVREAFNRSLMLVVVYVIPVVAVLYLLRTPIADLFNAEGAARDLIYLFCGPLSLAWIFNGVIFLGNAAYNNLGHPFYSTWVNWGRNTLGLFPFVWLGAILYGAEGVLIGQMLGGALVAIVSFVLAERMMAQAERRQRCEAEDPALAGHDRAFSLQHLRR